jgi:NAD(P)-dependent dehydrogenase (short-subunit alcohol dehydrogenase family)
MGLKTQESTSNEAHSTGSNHHSGPDIRRYFQLTGLSALVTGGGTGIGQAVALVMAEAGVKKITITGRRMAPLVETAHMIKDRGLNCLVDTVTCDITKAPELAELVLRLKKAGDLDILVNNAGLFEGASLPETTDLLWEETMRVNVQAPLGLIRDLLPLLRRSEAASIINISSTLAVKPIPNAVAYNTSKAALIQMTKSLALELGPESIRVNAIMPAIVETPMYRGRFDNEVSYQEGVKAARDLHPLGRMGQPEDIALAVLFLASRASRWMTGVALPVDGGMLVT